MISKWMAENETYCPLIFFYRKLFKEVLITIMWLDMFLKRKKKEERTKTKVERMDNQQIKVTPSPPPREDFYKDLESRSTDEFLKDIADTTLTLWHLILKFSLKKNQIGKTRKVNRVKVFAECTDVTMAVMRTLKAQLTTQALSVEMGILAAGGKPPKFLDALNHCIRIANAEDFKKFRIKMDRKKRNRESYVA